MKIDLNIKDYEERFSRVMIDEVLSKLDGTHPFFDNYLFDSKPSRQVILGTLAPFDPEKQETKTAVRTNSISISFLTREFNSLKIKPYFEVYYRKKNIKIKDNEEKTKEPTEEEKSVWKKKPLLFDDTKLDSLNKEALLDFKSSIEEIKKDLEFDSNQKIDWSAKISLEIDKYHQGGEAYYLITVTIENLTERYEKDSKTGEYKVNSYGRKIESRYETCLFNTKMEIYLNNEVVPFKYEYEYEGYKKNYTCDFNTTNCYAYLDKISNKIMTSHFKIFSQDKKDPKIRLSNLNESVKKGLSFEILKDPTKNIDFLDEIKRYLDEFYNYYTNNHYDSKEYLDLIERFKLNLDRFNEGLTVLKTNSKAKKAFELLQETFYNTNKGDYSEWRLFQLVFILSVIPDIIDPLKRSEVVEILHVETGGGKSEAYFGLVLFSAFFDRLNGKFLGITAITKFPLRMLSIQQLQRIAQLFIWAEKIRKDNQLSGNEFSVGYFVGYSEDFPRYNYELVKNIKNGANLKGKIIEKCPLTYNHQKCDGNIFLKLENRTENIVHQCDKCGNSFKLLYTDEEIYQVLPTFIVSTVDKLAGVSGNRRFKLLFGGKLDQCPDGHGFIPHNDSCEHYINDKKQCKKKGKELRLDFCQGPTLIIQDEMHLIKESFGTIDSHFESFLENLQMSLKGKPFKNIAMTATLCGAKKQINELYKKQVRIFPGETPDSFKIEDKKDFFFDYPKNKIHRFVIGLSPNLRDNQFACLLTLRYISEFIRDFENEARKDFKLFSQKWGMNEQEYNSLLHYYKTILTYHNKKADVHGMSYYLKPVANDKIDEYKIKPEILTGECTLDEIKEIISRIKTYNTIEKKEILATFATNVVSHGVDIEKWNIMLFQGIPRNTSEYIQALSRCGRKHLGSVFLWFYPSRVRDQSFYQNFKEYHEILSHHIEPVPISRWANLGFLQTFNSLFCGSILNYFSEIADCPLYKVDEVNRFFSEIGNRYKLIEFLEKAYIIKSNEVGSGFFKENIAKQVEKRLNYLVRYDGNEKDFFPNALADCSDDTDPDIHYFRNQYGMRGIQDTVIISPVNIYENNVIRNYKVKTSEDNEEDDEDE